MDGATGRGGSLSKPEKLYTGKLESWCRCVVVTKADGIFMQWLGGEGTSKPYKKNRNKEAKLNKFFNISLRIIINQTIHVWDFSIGCTNRSAETNERFYRSKLDVFLSDEDRVLQIWSDWEINSGHIFVLRTKAFFSPIARSTKLEDWWSRPCPLCTLVKFVPPFPLHFTSCTIILLGAIETGGIAPKQVENTK